MSSEHFAARASKEAPLSHCTRQLDEARESKKPRGVKTCENHNSVEVSNLSINVFVFFLIFLSVFDSMLMLGVEIRVEPHPLSSQDSCNSNGNWSATGSTTSHTKLGVRGLEGQQCVALLELLGLLWTSSRLWTPAT